MSIYKLSSSVPGPQPYLDPTGKINYAYCPKWPDIWTKFLTPAGLLEAGYTHWSDSPTMPTGVPERERNDAVVQGGDEVFRARLAKAVCDYIDSQGFDEVMNDHAVRGLKDDVTHLILTTK